jgi:hypothetical protein
MALFKKKPKKEEVDPGLQGDGHITAEQLTKILADNARVTADLAARATDQRFSELLSRGGGIKVPGGVSAEEAKNLRGLIYAPEDERMMEMTIFNEKECALHPWLKTFECSLHMGRPHGSLLGKFLLYKEKCNRSLNGNLLDQTVTMAGMDIQKDQYGESHVSG